MEKDVFVGIVYGVLIIFVLQMYVITIALIESPQITTIVITNIHLIFMFIFLYILELLEFLVLGEIAFIIHLKTVKEL